MTVIGIEMTDGEPERTAADLQELNRADELYQAQQRERAESHRRNLKAKLEDYYRQLATARNLLDCARSFGDTENAFYWQDEINELEKLIATIEAELGPEENAEPAGSDTAGTA